MASAAALAVASAMKAETVIPSFAAAFFVTRAACFENLTLRISFRAVGFILPES
jgi:hypothetical protein